MRALDPLMYEKETLEYLDKLLKVDAMRANYYKDLSMCRMEFFSLHSLQILLV